MKLLIPLNKKVIVKSAPKEEKSRGGIYIPETVDRKAPTKGIVIAISEDSGLALKIKRGDEILFSKYSGIEITLKSDNQEEKDQDVLILNADMILAKVVIQEDKK